LSAPAVAAGLAALLLGALGALALTQLGGSEEPVAGPAPDRATNQPARDGAGSRRDATSPRTDSPANSPRESPAESPRESPAESPAESPRESPAESPTAPPAESPDASPGEVTTPSGYTLQEDPRGFQVAVPEGWQRRLDGPTRVDFVSPDGTSFVRVDQRAEALPDAEDAWEEAEPAVADRLPGYRRIRIDDVDYRDWDAADWEFTWEGGNGTVHVLNRGIGTETKGWALYVSAPDAAWERVGVPVFDTVTETFQPTS
ncbi:MAG: hypothetical protein M3P83_08820, partial [Actinomycetota bacterium]|nr:hypothetical protein [Actinomycetota bacterium]